MSIRSMTWWASSFATIVLPSWARKASSAENRWPFGRLPAAGNRQRIRWTSSTTRRRPLPRSAIRSPRPNRPASGGVEAWLGWDGGAVVGAGAEPPGPLGVEDEADGPPDDPAPWDV